MRYAAIGCLMIACVMVIDVAAGRAEEASPLRLDDFSLRDFRGKPHTFGEFSDAKLLVVAFVGTECPLAKLYAPRLQELHKQYHDRGVALVAVDANRQDSITEL